MKLKLLTAVLFSGLTVTSVFGMEEVQENKMTQNTYSLGKQEGLHCYSKDLVLDIPYLSLSKATIYDPQSKYKNGVTQLLAALTTNSLSLTKLNNWEDWSGQFIDEDLDILFKQASIKKTANPAAEIALSEEIKACLASILIALATEKGKIDPTSTRFTNWIKSIEVLPKNYAAPDKTEVRHPCPVHAFKEENHIFATQNQQELSDAVRHKTVKEHWTVLSGNVEFTLWDKNGIQYIFNLLPGDFINIPTDWIFQFKNTGNKKFTAFIRTTPPWPNMDEGVVLKDKLLEKELKTRQEKPRV